MSDLRDRIIAAIARADQDWLSDRPLHEDMANSVIAELGLYREGRDSRTVTNEQGATYRIEGGHRYVTDWKVNDE